VAEQDSYGEEPEWGAIAEKSGYLALKAIDSTQAVRDHTAYPAVLLTTGVTDPRVAPFHVGKMTARLQAASSSGKPILLRVDFDAGHGIGSTRAQQDLEAADTFAFLLWQTGVSAGVSGACIRLVRSALRPHRADRGCLRRRPRIAQERYGLRRYADVGLGKIFALEEQRVVGRHGESVGETITDIQTRWVTAFAVAAKRTNREIGMMRCY
jgi:hypothetical protein